MQQTRRLLFKRMLGAITIAVAGQANADTASFPDRPVSIVIPFAAGGGLDITARILADKLKSLLGQPVVVLNKPGAGSALGARFVAGAPADGYTLLMSSGSAYGYIHRLVPNFDLGLADFVPVASVASNPSVIVVSTDLPVTSLKELADYGTSKPDALSFCSTGMNGLNHLQLEMFKREVKAKTGHDFKVTHVPYNGLAPALIALKARQVQACMLPYTALVKNLQGKDLRILAVQRGDRLSFMPDLPTAGEQGFPTMDSNDAFINVAAPKGTPPPVVAKLEAAFQQALADPAVRKKLEDLDVQPVYKDSRDTGKWLHDDVNKFDAIISAAGLSSSN